MTPQQTELFEEIKTRGDVRSSDRSFISWYVDNLFFGDPFNARKCLHAQIYDIFKAGFIGRKKVKSGNRMVFTYFAIEQLLKKAKNNPCNSNLDGL